MASNSSGVNRWNLWLEGLAARQIAATAGGLGAVAVVLVAALVWVLETVHVVWLRAPLVLLTGAGLGLSGLALGAALYELRRRRP